MYKIIEGIEKYHEDINKINKCEIARLRILLQHYKSEWDRMYQILESSDSVEIRFEGIANIIYEGE